MALPPPWPLFNCPDFQELKPRLPSALAPRAKPADRDALAVEGADPEGCGLRVHEFCDSGLTLRWNSE